MGPILGIAANGRVLEDTVLAMTMLLQHGVCRDVADPGYIKQSGSQVLQIRDCLALRVEDHVNVARNAPAGQNTGVLHDDTYEMPMIPIR